MAPVKLWSGLSKQADIPDARGRIHAGAWKYVQAVPKPGGRLSEEILGLKLKINCYLNSSAGEPEPARKPT